MYAGDQIGGGTCLGGAEEGTMLEPIGHESALHLILASIVELGVKVFDCGDHVEFKHQRICR